METIKKLIVLLAIIMLAACQKDEFVIQDESDHCNTPIFRSGSGSKNSRGTHGNLSDNTSDIKVTDKDNADEDKDVEVTDTDGTEGDGDGE